MENTLRVAYDHQFKIRSALGAVGRWPNNHDTNRVEARKSFVDIYNEKGLCVLPLPTTNGVLLSLNVNPTKTFLYGVEPAKNSIPKAERSWLVECQAKEATVIDIICRKD
jgi:hypothetical protein